jgi:hypothetical protein
MLVAKVQQADFAGMALKQGFGDRGRQTEVRIGLVVSWVVQVVGQGTGKSLEPLLNLLAAFQPRPDAASQAVIQPP